MRVLTALILFSSLASAACVNGYPTISEEYRSSVMVLIGKVVAHAATPAKGDVYDGVTYTVIPLRVLKGNPGSRIRLFSENSTGRFPMKMKREYLLFIYRDGGRLIVDNCGNSDLMPHGNNALAQTIATAAHGFDSQAALISLHEGNPKVGWRVSSAKTADFDCDGKADMVVLGSEKGRAVVGVVWGRPTKRPQIFTFSIGKSMQDAFSEQPKTIVTFPIECKEEEGKNLPGCKVIPACRTFFVRDDDTDPFNFYWDAQHGILRWWRE